MKKYLHQKIWMLEIRDIADYWKDPAVLILLTPVMQAAAPEFTPVFPGYRSLKS